MEKDESKYKETDNPEDIKLVPTESTFKLFDRWEFIAEKFPEVSYPERLIREEDFFQVQKILSENRKDMDRVSVRLGEELARKSGENLSSETIASYIYYDTVTEDYFEEFLKENDME